MRNFSVEKRADAVIKWIERAKKSYRNGSVESAYIDTECACADLEELRLNILPPHNHSRINFMKPFRVIILAVMIVVLTVYPLSRETPPVITEPSPIIAHEESSEPSEPSEPSQPQPQKNKRPRKASVQKRITKAEKPSPKPKTKREKTVPYDRIYALIQTGQRAIKNNTTVHITGSEH